LNEVLEPKISYMKLKVTYIHLQKQVHELLMCYGRFVLTNLP